MKGIRWIEPASCTGRRVFWIMPRVVRGFLQKRYQGFRLQLLNQETSRTVRLHRLVLIATILCSVLAGCPPRKPEPFVTDFGKAQLPIGRAPSQFSNA
jgi:hypothetical protein